MNKKKLNNGTFVCTPGNNKSPLSNYLQQRATQLCCGSCIICSLALYPDLNYLRTLITRHNKNDLYATRPRALGLTEIKMRDCNNAPLWDFVSVARVAIEGAFKKYVSLISRTSFHSFKAKLFRS